MKPLDSIPERVQVSDAELVRAIAGGDEEAFVCLYNQYKSTLFGLLLRILHSSAEAEDVLQEVFLRVWQRAPDFDETRGQVFAWLVMMTRSRAIDRLRALNARDRTATKAFHEMPLVVSDAADNAIGAERREILLRALEAIPEGQRRALLLAYFEGLSQSEIAEQLAEPLGTVKTRTRSGLKRLRELLRKRLKKEA